MLIGDRWSTCTCLYYLQDFLDVLIKQLWCVPYLSVLISEQVTFLNSVIVDLQRKNDELRARLEAMETSYMNGDHDDIGFDVEWVILYNKIIMLCWLENAISVNTSVSGHVWYNSSILCIF